MLVVQCECVLMLVAVSLASEHTRSGSYKLEGLFMRVIINLAVSDLRDDVFSNVIRRAILLVLDVVV